MAHADLRHRLVGWDSVFSRAANAIIRDEVGGLGGEIIGEEYVLPDSTEVTSACLPFLVHFRGSFPLNWLKTLSESLIWPKSVVTIFGDDNAIFA